MGIDRTRVHVGGRMLLIMGVMVTMTACAGRFPSPTQVRVPTPIQNNSGKYLSPYTSDGTVAPWVRKARAASAGSTIGQYAGQKVGEKALGSVPFVGGMLGQRAGNAAGRAIALKLVGGEKALKEGSDLSFNSADDMAVFLYAFQPTDPEEMKQKQKVMSLTYDLYPDVQARFPKAVKKAKLRKGEAFRPVQLAPGAPVAAPATGGRRGSTPDDEER